MTYNYVFVRVEPKGLFGIRPETDYQQIIRKRAKQGWRLVTIITPPS